MRFVEWAVRQDNVSVHFVQPVPVIGDRLLDRRVPIAVRER